MSDEPRYCYRHPDRETGLSCSECDRPICYECMTPAPVGLRCPEHSGKPQGVRKVTVAAERAVTGSHSRLVAPITMALIAINVGVYLAELALGGSADGTGNWIYNHGALVANGIYSHGQVISGPIDATAPAGYSLIGVTHGEWWRLITAAFLHLGPLHLGLNMLSLYFVGPVLETMIGRWRYLLLYLAAGLAGSAGALYTTTHSILGESPASVTVGASGAIFGALGALLVLERRGLINSGGQIVMWIVLNLIFTFAYSGISVGGHIGGLVGGILVMLGYTQFRRSAQLSVATVVTVGLASILLAYAIV